MKQHKTELDVDFIGGSGPLTRDEEKVISEFIRASRERQKQKTRQKHKPPTLTGVEEKTHKRRPDT
ncbi:MAG: hypothetical protein ABI472_06275 [Ginsengibacter sp.]